MTMFSNYIILECILYLIIPVLVGLAFLTLAERKIMGYLQQRRGPNVEGFLGFLQPIFDGLKLLQKESIVPKKANLFLFILAPILIFALSLMAWVVLPFSEYGGLADLKISVIYILAISSLHVYGIIIAGWSSNSRYAFLGALRSTAQMISYELAVGLILLTINMCAGSLHIYDIVDLQENIWLVCPFFPFFIIFFIASLAELNRAPFDLPEAEGELVAGYNVEYSSMGFALFFLAEYANILFMSTLNVLLFFGGWNNFGLTLFNVWGFDILFFIKISILVFIKIWVRAAFPRYRYDQLMRLGWKVFLPLTLALFCIYSLILYIFTI